MVSNPFAEGLSVKVNGDTSGATGALSNLTASLTGTKTKVAALGAALGGALAVGGLAVATKAAADFEASMQKSVAIMGDLSGSMREDMEQAARDVAKTTKASAEEAAESYYFLASAGLDASQSLEAMPEVARFAQAGNLEMAKATDYATDIMKAFGKEAEDLGGITDKLTGVVTRHNQTMNGMGQAMSMVAPIASGLGVSIQETATMIGFLGDAGIKGSRAGRTLRQAFNRLNNVSGPAQETLDELGVSVQDSSGEMRDMSAIIADLNEAGANTADVMEIFGARAGPGMQVLLDQGSEALVNETEKIGDMQGITQEVADKQMNSFNAQLGVLKDSLNDIGITIGKWVLPYLNKLVRYVNDALSAVDDLSSVSNRSWGQIKKDIGTAVNFAIDAFNRAWNWLKANGPRIMKTVTTIFVMVVKDAAKWIKNNGPRLIGEAFELIGKAIRFIFLDLKKIVTEGEDSLIGQLLNDIGTWVKQNGPGIVKSAFGFVVDVVIAAFKGLYRGLIGNSIIPQMFADIASFVKGDGLKTIAYAFGSMLAVIKSMYQTAFNSIFNIIAGFIERIINKAASVLELLPDKVQDKIGISAEDLRNFELPRKNANFAEIVEQNQQEVRVILDERTDVVEGRIEQGAENVVAKRERRTTRNTGTQPSP